MGMVGMLFGMGGKDMGMKASMDSASKSMRGLNDLIGRQGDAADKARGKSKGLFDVFKPRVDTFNIGNIAQNVRSLTGDTGNLTSNLESMATANAKALAPMIAGWGKTGKEARKLESRMSGMAISMNVSAESVGKVFQMTEMSGEKTKEALKALGLSEKDWIKITEASGVSADDFSSVLGDMTASWGASSKDAAAMVNNIMAIGQQAKIGVLGIKGMNAQLDTLDSIFKHLPPGMERSGKDIKMLMESTYKLAGAFVQMGKTPEEATKAAEESTKMFAEQATQFKLLKEAGKQTELDNLPIMKYLTMLGVNFDDAAKIVETGSFDAVQGVKMINDKFAEFANKKGMPAAKHAFSMLQESLGESASGLEWLTSNLDVGTKALADMANMTVKGDKALKNYGDQAYRTGRTLQDMVNLSKEMMMQQLRNLTAKQGRKYAQQIMQSNKEIGDTIKQLGSNETWGPVMHAWSLFDKLGTKGLLMGLAGKVGKDASKSVAKLSAGLDLVMGGVQKVTSEFGPLFSILAQLGPLGAALGVGGGLVAWFTMDEASRNEILKNIKPIFEKVKEYVFKAWDGAKLWWQKEGPGIKKDLSDAWNKAMDAIKTWWADNKKWIYEKIQSAVSALYDGLKSLVTNEELWGEGGLLGAMQKAVSALWGMMDTKMKVFAIGFAALKVFGPSGVASTFATVLSGQLGNAVRMAGIGGIIVTAGMVAIDEIFKYLENKRQEEIKKTEALIEKLTKERAKESEGYKFERGLITEQVGAKGTTGNIQKLMESMSAEQIRSYTKQQDFAAKLMAKRGLGVGGAYSKEDIANEKVLSELAKIRSEQGMGTYEGVKASLKNTILADLKRLQAIPQIQEQLMLAQSKGTEEFAKAINNLVGTHGAFYGTTSKELQDMLVQAGNIKARMDEFAKTGQDIDFTKGGLGMTEQVVAGIKQGAPVMVEAWDEPLQTMADQLPHSEPKGGPLDGKFLYEAGFQIIDRIRIGMESGQYEFQASLSKILQDSFIFSFDEYEKKVAETMSKSSALEAINQRIVDAFSVNKVMGGADVSLTKQVKAEMTTLMNIPGISGVTAAIVIEGAKTRKILTNIDKNIEGIWYNTQSSTSQGKAPSVLPAGI